MEAEFSTLSLVNRATDFSYILNVVRLTCGRLARYRTKIPSLSVATALAVARALAVRAPDGSNRALGINRWHWSPALASLNRDLGAE